MSEDTPRRDTTGGAVEFVGLHICSFSQGDRQLVLPNGERFLFDWSDRFGPQFVDARGREKKAPGSRHAFWEALTLWCKQGHRTMDGEPPACVYDVPEPEEWVRMAGNHLASPADAVKIVMNLPDGLRDQVAARMGPVPERVTFPTKLQKMKADALQSSGEASRG